MPGAVYAKEAAAARHAKRGRESATAIRIRGDRRGEDSHPGAHPAQLTHHGLHFSGVFVDVDGGTNR